MQSHAVFMSSLLKPIHRLRRFAGKFAQPVDEFRYWRGRRRIFPSPVLRINTFPPFPILQRFTRGEGVMSSLTIKPSLARSSIELVSMVKLEPPGTVRVIVPSPV